MFVVVCCSCVAVRQSCCENIAKHMTNCEHTLPTLKQIVCKIVATFVPNYFSKYFAGCECFWLQLRSFDKVPQIPKMFVAPAASHWLCLLLLDCVPFQCGFDFKLLSSSSIGTYCDVADHECTRFCVVMFCGHWPHTMLAALRRANLVQKRKPWKS